MLPPYIAMIKPGPGAGMRIQLFEISSGECILHAGCIATASLLALGFPRLQGIAGGAGCSVCEFRLFTNFRWRVP